MHFRYPETIIPPKKFAADSGLFMVVGTETLPPNVGTAALIGNPVRTRGTGKNLRGRRFDSVLGLVDSTPIDSSKSDQPLFASIDLGHPSDDS